MDLLNSQSPVAERKVFTVSRLNRDVRGLLEGHFPLLWLEGEVSNFIAHGSGHWYLSLKDERAQVRCAMFRNRNRLLRFKPQNGDKVLVRARISVYEPRGDYQLLLEHMEPAGEGDLQRRFAALKAKLEREGLFDPANKHSLPELQRGGLRRIGIITSPSGAAVRDVLSVLQRRYPLSAALIYPVRVQGEQAAGDIASAIALANQRRDCDILLLVRGGGSLEDLWAFNEEPVARAIAASALPIVSGVGHETDFTIADFVADRRAPTPSVAAEMVSPAQRELRARLHKLQGSLHAATAGHISRATTRLHSLHHRLQLQHPRQQLQQQSQRLDELHNRLHNGCRVRLSASRQQLALAEQRLHQHSPKHQLQTSQQQLQRARQALQSAVQARLQAQAQQLALSSRALHAVSPLQTLERGYAIALHGATGKAIKSPHEVKQGDTLNIQLAEGQIDARVE
ncbi:MAG: exodeoxyribonuclease VII large subunit [Gammaproteobacteria bacterium]|nr:MAG: exodeoxyribonuclease VII large subunit [Gammaproteobacteria bacterium]